MINLPHLNNLKKLVFFFVLLIFNDVFAADPVDIWKKQEGQNLQNNQSENKIEQKIKSPILSGDVNKIVVEICKKIPITIAIISL